MALVKTDAGRNLMRDILTGAQTAGQVYYLALGAGGATLNAALGNGTAYTALTTTALPAALPAGQSVTLVSGTNTQVVTVGAAGAALGATSVPVNSFTANFAYPVGTGLVNTPAGGDTQLQSEFFRKAVTSVSNGATGEGLITVYLAPGDANQQIQEVGWFAGASATGSANTGVLLARGVYSHNHGPLESINFTLDNTF